MSITAYKIEAVGHDRTGKNFGYVNIMYRYGNKQSCPRPDQCEKMDAWGMSTWFMCTPQAAEKLIAMDYDNLAIQETTIVG